jgi:hypothetical protein
LTPSTNPKNAIYKLATNKTKKSQTMTTLKKLDGSLTANLNETVKVMSHYLIPKDDQTNDTNYHKCITAQSKDPIQTADDRDYTQTEVKKHLLRSKAQQSTRKRRHNSRNIPESIYTTSDINPHTIQ